MSLIVSFSRVEPSSLESMITLAHCDDGRSLCEQEDLGLKMQEVQLNVAKSRDVAPPPQFDNHTTQS